MRIAIATTPEAANKAQWVDLDMPGFEGNLDLPEEERIRLKLRPNNRSALAVIERKTKIRAERLPDEILPTASGKSKGEVFVRALADHLVEDWQNFEDQDGNLLECNRTNKVWAFENLDLAMFVIAKSKEIAATRIEEDEKN
jgi:hypothetical protein